MSDRISVHLSRLDDKELTRHAARAAGIDHPEGEHSRHDDGRLWDCARFAWWNPLHSRADAQSLAASLGIPDGTNREIVLAAAAMANGLATNARGE